MTSGINIDTEIHSVLTNLGIYQSAKGYRYIHSSIKKAIEDPEYLNLITKCMYPYLAKSYGTTYTAVERAMRYTISNMPDTSYRKELFCSDIEHFSNKEFIAHIVNYLSFR